MLLMLGILVLAIISVSIRLSAQSALGTAQNATTKNMTASMGNSTVSGMKNTTTAGNTTSNNNNNVTAASGNNGHIYRGGAAAGSGGE